MGFIQEVRLLFRLSPWIQRKKCQERICKVKPVFSILTNPSSPHSCYSTEQRPIDEFQLLCPRVHQLCRIPPGSTDNSRACTFENLSKNRNKIACEKQKKIIR